MSLQRKSLTALICLVTFAISACGFTPVHQKKEASGALLAMEIPTIGNDRYGQILKASLEDLFNPESKNLEPEYRLQLSLKNNKVPLVIERDRTVDRYNLVFVANYSIIERATNKAIYTGKSKVVGSFNSVESDYSTFVAEEDTSKRIMKELARDIHFRTAEFFARKK
jgi:LPS-assembly lipoprotein